jgi:rhodanese-related sulfurtransferase
MGLPWWFPFGAVPEVTATELAASLGSKTSPLLLDVRSPLEFAGGHIEGAMNVPVTGFPEALADLALQPDRAVVAICLTAHRSTPAVRLLRRRGLDARQLAGGMLAWRAAGLPEHRG